jgi:hypothetical protein
MATYVLVHGGGHGGWSYRKVARLLRAGGHDGKVFRDDTAAR